MRKLRLADMNLKLSRHASTFDEQYKTVNPHLAVCSKTLGYILRERRGSERGYQATKRHLLKIESWYKIKLSNRGRSGESSPVSALIIIKKEK